MGGTILCGEIMLSLERFISGIHRVSPESGAWSQGSQSQNKGSVIYERNKKKCLHPESNESLEFFTQEICSDSTTQVYLSRRLIDLWASRESRYMDSVQ